jgi:hypothetical protein
MESKSLDQDGVQKVLKKHQPQLLNAQLVLRECERR